MKDKEIFISVDIESSGPIPGEYSLLSIGACLLSDPEESLVMLPTY
jgi:ribonuclease T